MLTYLQVLLIFIVSPIIALGCLFSPMIGRRELLKISWLMLMATIYTTPWDNFIIARGGWSYPAGSIIGTIHWIPIEEHLFFVLQPILIVLLHSILTHSTLLPFRISPSTRRRLDLDLVETTTEKQKQTSRNVQTLRRRPLAASLWLVQFLAGLYLVNDAHDFLPEWTIQEYALGMRAFYLGWIMLWISPVLGWLTYLGGDMGRGEWKTTIIGSGWLCMVDTIAIRNGAWSIAKETSLGIDIWRGLPVEECLFFILTTHLIIISTNLISHLHALLVLSPDLPPCPPSNLAAHIRLLAQVAFNPPPIPEDTLIGLVHAEETLREGSKSFDVAKLAFGREMRIALVAVYAWCRMTDNIVDDDPTEVSDKPNHEIKTEYLAAIKAHLIKSYDPATTSTTLNALLDHLPLSPADRAVFHTFTNLIPRLVPIHPFLELCNGYETDLHFTRKLAQADRKLEDCLPILNQNDLLGYADDVAGSVASACCYLAWSILSSCTDNSTRPVRDHVWGTGESDQAASSTNDRRTILQNAREMGHALQLVNIARDVKKDALTNRLYIPLSSFPDNEALYSFLHPTPERPAHDSKPYVLELVQHAFVLRERTAPYMELLPREAKGGLRAMVASYFEIAEEIMKREGEVTNTGVKVSKKKRLRAAAGAMWGFT